jgi:hypothetical protein
MYQPVTKEDCQRCWDEQERRAHLSIEECGKENLIEEEKISTIPRRSSRPEHFWVFYPID